jgi:hypothetical protein
MTSDKTQRDAINNQRFKDTYVHASQERWLKWYPGIDFKLLRRSEDHLIQHGVTLCDP